MSESLVVVDARHLKSGIGTYLENLVPALVESTPWRWRLIGPERWQDLSSDRVEWVYCDLPIYTLAEHRAISRLAAGGDLLWVPQYNAPLTWSGPLLITLHDLIHRMPAYTPPSLKTWLSGRLMARSLARASRIITVSEYSRAQLAHFFPGREEKCTVIHNGVQLVPDAEAPDIDRPYVLSFGNGLPHKNLLRLMQAFIRLDSNRPEILVVAGPEGRASESLREFADQHSGRIQMLGAQDTNGWASLMQHAQLYCCPSFEEGFGLPPLEALSTGIPVACARAASLPEILQEAAIWFDPLDTASIAQALETGLDDAEERNRVVREGTQRIAKFKWGDSVSSHQLVLESCLP